MTRTTVTLTLQKLEHASFPHPTRDIRVCETHLSYVVLTGDFAYKIKKALQLDFIDTTSLERRRELCKAEVRLNRRYAADLYLDVVPITISGEQLAFGKQGKAVEYAVKMRQFDPGAELQALLDRDVIHASDMEALADRVADVHLHADVYGEPFPSGSNAYCRKATENTASVLQRAELIGAQHDAAALQRWTKTLLEEQQSQLQTRERQGFIRECHGDLHSGNVVRWRDALLPFDCIEFDAELRFIDVLNDIAFLAMDLIERKRSELAFVFLNRYLERTGDYTGLTVLRSYLVYRALVRAKVELISLQQHPASKDTAERAQSLLKTAAGFMQPTTPTLIVMHGASGSGKSWLSEQLVPKLPALRIRSDLERKRLAGIDPFAHGRPPDERIYTLEFNERTYDHLLECARAVLRGGMHVIVDAAFLREHERASFARLARREHAHFVTLSCTAEREMLEQRIAARRAARNDPSDADERVLHRQLDTMEPIAPHERDHAWCVNTQDPDVLTEVLERWRVMTALNETGRR